MHNRLFGTALLNSFLLVFLFLSLGLEQFAILRMVLSLILIIIMPGVLLLWLVRLGLFQRTLVANSFFVLAAGTVVALLNSGILMFVNDFSGYTILVVTGLSNWGLLILAYLQNDAGPPHQNLWHGMPYSLKKNLPFLIGLLLVLSTAFFLRAFVIAEFPIWTDRFTCTFRYIMDSVISTGRFGPLPENYFGSYASGIYLIMKHPTATLLTAQFSILSGLAPDALSFVPFGYLFLLPFAAVTLGDSFSPKNSSAKHSLMRLVMIAAVLFLPDSVLIISINPNSGGTALLGGLGFALLLFVLLLQWDSLTRDSLSGSIFALISALVSLTAYRTTGLITIAAYCAITILVYLSPRGCNKSAKLSILLIPVIAAALGAYTQYVNLELIPSEYWTVVQNAFPMEIPLWIIFALVFGAIVLSIMMLRRIGLIINVEDRRVVFLLLTIAVVVVITLVMSSTANSDSGQSEFLHPIYLSLNSVSLLRYVEYTLLLLPSVLWGIYYLRGHDKAKAVVEKPFILITYGLVVGFSAIIFLFWGGLVFLVGRTPTYLSFALVPLSILVIFRALPKRMVPAALVLFVIIPGLISSSILVGLDVADVGTVTQDEYDGLLSIVPYLQANDVIYTDQRIANTLIIISGILSIEGPNPSGSGYENDLEEIIYTTNATLAHERLKTQYRSVKFLVLSSEFKEKGIFGFDFRLRPLTAEEFMKFYDNTYFIEIYNDGTISLLELV